MFYDVKEKSAIQYIPCTDENEMKQAWGNIALSQWNVFTLGLLKVFSWLMQSDTMFLFVAHHLLTDGRGLLGLIREFTDCLVEGKEPKLAEEHLITSVDDLHEGSNLSFVSRFLVDRAEKQWRKENRSVAYEEYLRFCASGDFHLLVCQTPVLTESGPACLSFRLSKCKPSIRFG